MRYEYFERSSPPIAVLQSLKMKGGIWDFRRTCRDLNLSVLHVGDEELSWYHYCIPEVVNILREYGVKKLVGHSMGGYGALVFGRMLGIPSVCFSPQTILYPALDDRWADRWNEIRWKTKYPELLSLNGRFDADIYYCRDVEIDVFHADGVIANKYPLECSVHEDSVRIAREVLCPTS